MTVYESAEKIMEFYTFACISKAKKLYPEFRNFTINVKTNTGGCAGRASWKYDTTVMDVFINVQMMLQSEKSFDDIINDTIIHEVAHCVEYSIYGKDSGSHGKNWRDIAHSLGLPNASRVHDNKVVFTSGNYLYNVNGNIIPFSLTRHNKMQKRNVFYTLHNGDVVTKDMFIGTEEQTYMDYIPKKYQHILELFA